MEERKFNAPPHPTRPAVTPSPPHDTAGPHRSGPQRCRVTPERTARLLRPHQAPGLRCTGEPAIPRAAQGAPGAPRGGGAAAPQLPPGPSARHRGGGGCEGAAAGRGFRRRDPQGARPCPPCPAGGPAGRSGGTAGGDGTERPPQALPPRPHARWAGTAPIRALVGRAACQSEQRRLPIGRDPPALSVHLAELPCRHRRCSPPPSARLPPLGNIVPSTALPPPRPRRVPPLPVRPPRLPVPRSGRRVPSPPPPSPLPVARTGGGGIRRGRGVRPPAVRA